ncbi:MAG: hypothetical protein JXB17_00675, partial [Bacteroidales bacterium]|nr:hypothetical protein [Bacteroidales bacterium]
KGRTGEFLINFGANYSNKVYIGGALTISSLVYEYSNSHTENDLGNLSDYFDYFKYYFENQTKGRGISFKFGTIIKPVESLRLGLAIHLPTYYSLTDVYDASMESYIYGKYYKKDPTDYKEDPIYGTPLGKNTYEYKLTTPSKYVVSLGYQIQKIGLISVDVERVNYDNMRFKEGGDGYDYYEDNKIITDIYRATTNLRAGAEVRVGPLSFRGGFNYYQSPFESDEINKNANYMAVSGGLGYKYQNFFVDLGMYRQIHKETYLMYDYYYGDDYEYPIINTLNTQFIGTIGFRFN